MIDPLADKLLTSAAFISLVQMGLAPAWMVAIIIGREFAVTGLRSLAYSRGVAMPASPLGKIKMVGAGRRDPGADPRRRHLPDFFVIGQAALWVVVVTALVSAADYFRRFNQLSIVASPTSADRRRCDARSRPDPSCALGSANGSEPPSASGRLRRAAVVFSCVDSRSRASSRCSLCSNSATSFSK